ncbi:MAG: NAD(P)H-dependent oxidoreductase subunit E [Deltaproteobacteria bacterium]|jgi:NADH-quinone oxidoreductase subunit E|nr:NAD(P)H-dependent oxidoreductase subunit E [Deltaproteobacteria bacterium]
MEDPTLDKILNQYKCDSKKLLPILQAVQEKEKYLSEATMKYVAHKLDLPETQVFGVASFYSHFALTAKGKYIIRLCDGTACHVRKSDNVRNTIRETIGLTGNEQTSKDLLFTLEIVSCLGACGLAPVMVINEEVYGQITPEKAQELITEIKRKENANN